MRYNISDEMAPDESQWVQIEGTGAAADNIEGLFAAPASGSMISDETIYAAFALIACAILLAALWAGS